MLRERHCKCSSGAFGSIGFTVHVGSLGGLAVSLCMLERRLCIRLVRDHSLIRCTCVFSFLVFLSPSVLPPRHVCARSSFVRECGQVPQVQHCIQPLHKKTSLQVRSTHAGRRQQTHEHAEEKMVCSWLVLSAWPLHRNCGRTYCGACSAATLPLPHFGLPEPVRVCGQCEQALKNPQPKVAAAAAPAAAKPTEPGQSAPAVMSVLCDSSGCVL